jgi:biotin transport system substrate-specific component
MISSQALIPQIIRHQENKVAANLLAVFAGVALMTALAQINIPLPWTPVPITGQTFGVTFLSLIWGRNRGLAVMLSYIGLGIAGAPLFAMGQAGFSWGPTSGYLIGMVLASAWLGTWADRGWTKTFWRSYAASASGSLIVFGCGLYGLSFFLPKEVLFNAGLYPYLPGDLLKTVMACLLATGVHRAAKEKSPVSRA